ncbi:MAG: serine protease [Candidatus Sumerlaeota bacterium]|nr:serine protease [Candidatus Sumerlaeota bacterium]
MRRDRMKFYRKLETARNSKLLVYVTGDRRGLETQIHPEVLDFLAEHLDRIDGADKISLFLYTRGGSTSAAWSIPNLLRQFCKSLEIIIPSKAHSGGTLICLGADTIIMTKQATLGPIDPSVNTPLNPQVPGAPPMARAPVSVEAIKGFIEFARHEAKGNDHIHEVVNLLAEKVHPLVLGEVFRARSQIRMLASKLMSKSTKDKEKIEKVLSFLCSDSGSHDYTINRKEAREDLGLPIEKPDDDLYRLIKAIYDDIAHELELASPFNPQAHLGKQDEQSYSFRRVLIESIKGGTDVFVSEGNIRKITETDASGQSQQSFVDDRIFEGWRHEK